MSKNYLEAVEMGFTFWENVAPEGAVVEELVAMGYRAGLSDGVEALKASGAVARGEGALQLFAVTKEKLAALARKFEARAKDLKV